MSDLAYGCCLANRLSCLAPPNLIIKSAVQSIPDPVSKEVKGQNDEQNGHPGHQGHEKIFMEILLPIGQHAAKTWHGGLDAKSQKREPGNDKDGFSDAKACQHQNGGRCSWEAHGEG